MIPPSLSTAAKAVGMIKKIIIKMKEGWVGEASWSFLKPFFRSQYLISLILQMVSGEGIAGHRPVVKDRKASQVSSTLSTRWHQLCTIYIVFSIRGWINVCYYCYYSIIEFIMGGFTFSVWMEYTGILNEWIG